MAHVQKFSRGAVGGLSSHIERKTLNHSNEDIDNERTKENYDLCEKDGDMNARFQERMDDVHCLNRADVKVMADWVVTLPEEMKEASDSSKKQFFEQSYDFLSERYGKENVLAGVVHNDETTPHMHFAFMPVTFDEKKQREKVSAKEVLNRKDLKAFHQDLDKHLKEKIPRIYQKGILNNKTIGIDDVHILKEKSKEIEKLSEGMEKKKRYLTKEIKKVNNLQGKFENVYDTNKKLDELENKMSRTITGKRIVTSKDLNEFKKFVTGIQKSAIKSVGVAERLENKNTNLGNNLKNKTKQLEDVQGYKDRLLEDKKDLTNKVERLEAKNSVLEGELTVANSKLLEKGYNLSEMPEIEFKGRLVIDRLEKGYEPKNKKVADNWKGILEKNKEKRLINSEQLNQAMEKLKMIMQKIMSKVKDIGLSL